MENSAETKKFVVTVGRQFGSGGRELGKALANELGIDYYDKEILAKAASQAGVQQEFFERNDERSPSFISGIMSFNMGLRPSTNYWGSNSISDDSLYSSQSEVITQLARKGSCVIVGRTADYILRDFPNVFNLFIHAPEHECVKRIMRRGDVVDERKAREKIRRVNKMRASYYNFYTDKRWGHAASYDLSIDSSLMPIENLAKALATIIQQRFSHLP